MISKITYIVFLSSVSMFGRNLQNVIFSLVQSFSRWRNQILALHSLKTLTYRILSTRSSIHFDMTSTLINYNFIVKSLTALQNRYPSCSQICCCFIQALRQTKLSQCYWTMIYYMESHCDYDDILEICRKSVFYVC